MDPFCKHCDRQITRDPIQGLWIGRDGQRFCAKEVSRQKHEPGDGGDG